MAENGAMPSLKWCITASEEPSIVYRACADTAAQIRNSITLLWGLRFLLTTFLPVNTSWETQQLQLIESVRGIPLLVPLTFQRYVDDCRGLLPYCHSSTEKQTLIGTALHVLLL